jgi:hypothetical protein
MNKTKEEGSGWRGEELCWYDNILGENFSSI